MGTFFTLLIRGLRLRCPNCGKGKLFLSGFRMYEWCTVCGWRFEREEGYWTGAIAINLVVTEFLVAGFAIPTAVAAAFGKLPLIPVGVIGVCIAIGLPFLFFRHAKSLWMTLDFMIHPVDSEERD